MRTLIPGDLRHRVFIMYVNRSEVFASCLDSLGEFRSSAVVIDNSNQSELGVRHPQIEIVLPSAPLYCNQSYNLIPRIAEDRELDVFFIMHSDALASERVVQAMLD